MRISRFVFLFNRNGINLLYNSRYNSFYKISGSLSFVIEKCIKNVDEINFIDVEVLDKLKELGVVVGKDEDDDYVEKLKMKHYIDSMVRDSVMLTIAPTVSCNLRCPYCYEKNKPVGVMSMEVCDGVVDFLKKNTIASSYSLVWYGGEPLLGIDRIEYILDKLSDVSKKRAQHGMVTNGVLLKGVVLDVFERYPLDYIQITFDGEKETHDKIRVTHDGKGTFDEILFNLKNFVRRFPNTRVSIRVNLDKGNINQYLSLRTFLLEELKENSSRIFIYPGIIKGDYNCQEKDMFLKSPDVLSFYKEMAEKGSPVELYPEKKYKGCSATCVSGFIIGPNGEFYNCWEDMGCEDKVVGNVRNSVIVEKKIRRYVMHGHPFDDPVCLKCKMLPICRGGCAKERIENKFEGRQNDLCSIYRCNDFEGLKWLLYNLYSLKRT